MVGMNKTDSLNELVDPALTDSATKVSEIWQHL